MWVIGPVQIKRGLSIVIVVLCVALVEGRCGFQKQRCNVFYIVASVKKPANEFL